MTRRRRTKRCECGALVRYTSMKCVDCALAEYERQRLERWARITELWAEGLSVKAVALAMGTTPGALTVQMAWMRNVGWDLPRRRKGWKGFKREPRLPAEGPPKTKEETRVRLKQAIKTGKVVRPDECERCGREGYVDGHHHDYSKPLEVEWLCRRCHMAHHAAERQAA